MMMSASKTFSGTAIGIACHEGILSLEDRLVDLLPQYIPDPCPENLKKVTVRDLMTMSSGSDHEVPVDESWPQNILNRQHLRTSRERPFSTSTRPPRFWQRSLPNSLSISRRVRKSIPRIFLVTQSSTASATMYSDTAA